MGFGKPTRYWSLYREEVKPSVWDSAVADASEEYKNRMVYDQSLQTPCLSGILNGIPSSKVLVIVDLPWTVLLCVELYISFFPLFSVWHAPRCTSFRMSCMSCVFSLFFNTTWENIFNLIFEVWKLNNYTLHSLLCPTAQVHICFFPLFCMWHCCCSSWHVPCCTSFRVSYISCVCVFFFKRRHEKVFSTYLIWLTHNFEIWKLNNCTLHSGRLVYTC